MGPNSPPGIAGKGYMGRGGTRQEGRGWVEGGSGEGKGGGGAVDTGLGSGCSEQGGQGGVFSFSGRGTSPSGGGPEVDLDSLEESG